VISKDQTASGDLGVYDLKTKTITLLHNVTVAQGKNVLHGERVVVDTVSGNAHFDSNTDTPSGTATANAKPSGRVRAVILPNKDMKGAGPTNTMAVAPPAKPN
jgi:lipopolysaccharide export system protein LptA